MNIPKGETLWVSYIKNGVCTHIITSKPSRESYTMYQIDGDKLKKLGKSNSPPELEQRFITK